MVEVLACLAPLPPQTIFLRSLRNETRSLSLIGAMRVNSGTATKGPPARLADFMAANLSALDLLVVQIDGLHLGDDLVLVAANGVDGEENKHPRALVEGATENASTVQALLDNWSRAGSPRRLGLRPLLDILRR